MFALQEWSTTISGSGVYVQVSIFFVFVAVAVTIRDVFTLGCVDKVRNGKLSYTKDVEPPEGRRRAECCVCLVFYEFASTALTG